MTQARRQRVLGGPREKTDVDWQAALAEHDRWLRTVVRARLADGEATAEVMQDVALAAVRQAAPLEDPSKVGPWLYRLAVRHVLLYRRRMGRQRRLANHYQEHVEATSFREVRDPLDWLLADERRTLTRLALQRIPERDAEVLLLKYTENWSYARIAEHLGVSQSAVESRLHRARQRMRSELATIGATEVQT